MKTITAEQLIDELRKTGTARAMRLANKLERAYKPKNKNNDIERGATFNLATQLNESLRYIVALDPLTEIRGTLDGMILRVDHTHVPQVDDRTESTAVSILLRAQPYLESYAELLRNLNETSDNSLDWQIAGVRALLAGIKKL